jgi:hypothetical protein
MNTKQKGIAGTAIVALIAIVFTVPMAFAVLVIVATTAVAGFAIVLAAGSEAKPIDRGEDDRYNQRHNQRPRHVQQLLDNPSDELVERAWRSSSDGDN